ncbi:MAG: hypothetical protein AAGG48_30290 [Planctomycetota bacterium]
MHNNEQIETWVVRLSADHFEASEFAGLGEHASYASEGNTVWVRVTAPSTLVRQCMMKVPGERWQEREGLLFPPQCRVPTQSLPDCEWMTAEQWFLVEFPRANVALRANSLSQQELRLSRGGSERPPAALEASRDDLKHWAEAAADEQLRRLRWIVSQRNDARCLVLGRWLPPIPGKYMVESERVLYPAGFCWKPTVKASIVRKVFQVPQSAWLYWESNERFHIVEDGLFLPLTRSGLRSKQDD